MFGIETVLLAHTIDKNTHVVTMADRNVTTLTRIEKKVNIEDIISSKLNQISVNTDEIIEDNLPTKEPAKISLFFDFDSSKIPKTKTKEIGKVKSLELGSAKTVSIDGYASTYGSKKYNIVLSSKRIETAISLLKKNGYKGDFITIPHGEDGCETKTRKGQKKCQRTDIEVLY